MGEIDLHMRYAVASEGNEPSGWYGGQKYANDSAKSLALANGISYTVTDTKSGRSQIFAPTPGAAAARAKRLRQARIEGLQAAIEGECDGLAITERQAAAILDYVEGLCSTPTSPTPQDHGQNGGRS